MSEQQLLTPHCPLQRWEEFCSVLSQQVSGSIGEPNLAKRKGFP